MLYCVQTGFNIYTHIYILVDTRLWDNKLILHLMMFKLFKLQLFIFMMFLMTAIVQKDILIVKVCQNYSKSSLPLLEPYEF